MHILNRKRFISYSAVIVLAAFVWIYSSLPAYAMHISEGFLPLSWALFWFLISLPFFVVGLRSLTKLTRQNPELKLLLALAGAFSFVLSALKIPSVTGSSSHPTGTGLGAILFTPGIMTVLGTLVLLFQAILLAHGGLTTLGANVFSMAIVGPWVAYFIYCQTKGSKRERLGIFLACALGNLTTYLITSLQLALAFPAENGGFLASLGKFAGIFALTEIPLAISEGMLTVVVWNWLQSYAQAELQTLKLLRIGR